MQTIFRSICCDKFIFMDYISQEILQSHGVEEKMERAIEDEERERAEERCDGPMYM